MKLGLKRKREFIIGVRQIIIDEFKERKQREPSKEWVEMRLAQVLKALRVS